MTDQICSVCQKPKSQLHCGHCGAVVCKSCAVFLEEGSFSFYPEVPKVLSHTTYCNPCYTVHILPAQETYAALIEKAKNVLVYDKTQGKETRLMKRLEKPLRISNCPDREETLLRLAFLAAQANFEAIIDVNLTGEKVRDGSYQTTSWSGTGIPTSAPLQRIIKDRSITQNPN
jgi:hypothetical protein